MKPRHGRRSILGMGLAGAACGLALAATGCAHPQYTLLRPPASEAGEALLAAPGVAAAQTIEDGTFRLPLHPAAGAGPCRVDTSTFSVHPAALPGGAAASAASPSMVLESHLGPLDFTPAERVDGGDGVVRQQAALGPLAALGDLRAALLQLAAQGCFGAAFARASGVSGALPRIADSVTLSPLDALYLRVGVYPARGFADLAAGTRLIEIGPLLAADGAVAGSASQAFDVRARGDGLWLRPAGPPQFHPSTGRLAGPFRMGAADLAFPPQARRFRLLPLAQDHSAMLLAAANPEALEAATQRALADPAACAALGGGAVPQQSGAWCRAMPYLTTLAPQIRVRVRGRWEYVPLGATVGTAIQLAGLRPTGRLRVSRLYRGQLIPVRFDPGAGDILAMALVGGERIQP